MDEARVNDWESFCEDEKRTWKKEWKKSRSSFKSLSWMQNEPPQSPLQWWRTDLFFAHDKQQLYTAWQSAKVSKNLKEETKKGISKDLRNEFVSPWVCINNNKHFGLSELTIN